MGSTVSAKCDCGYHKSNLRIGGGNVASNRIRMRKNHRQSRGCGVVVDDVDCRERTDCQERRYRKMIRCFLKTEASF